MHAPAEHPAGMVTVPRPERTKEDYFDLNAALAAIRAGKPFTFPPFEIARSVINGKTYFFCCNFEKDAVQRRHRLGRFFETAELEAVAPHVPAGATVLDVGANVGNHAIFFADQCDAARVILIEPNPLALAPLIGNIELNRMADKLDTGFLGIGLSDCAHGGLGMRRHVRNLGGTKMEEGTGDLEVRAGDDLFPDTDFDLIKIDVEGMEMKVLAGLDRTIARCRPALMIEVDNEHLPAFRDWCKARTYREAGSWRRNPRNETFLILPEGDPR